MSAGEALLLLDEPSPMDPIIASDGKPFDDNFLAEARKLLAALTTEERIAFRNRNAEAIATSSAARLVVVSGPGTGKSTLFLQRIKHLYQNGSGSLLVTSFVRKLVVDLDNGINEDESLSQASKDSTDAFTLHRLARSIVERSHGTAKWRYRPHVRMIGQSWKEVVWNDVLMFHEGRDAAQYNWRAFEKRLHNDEVAGSEEWDPITETYFQLCQYYNAAGFADVVIRAREAVQEDPHLIQWASFIMDEYQDFNLAEERFLNALTERATNVLIVGDDDQVLYEGLKAAKPDLIRARYADESQCNAVLPFCGRCDRHIASAADAFIQGHDDASRITKLFLPLHADGAAEKVRVVACAAAATVVDYIAQWMDDHRAEIDARRQLQTNGESIEPFLLVLTPAREMKFLSIRHADALRALVTEFGAEKPRLSEDYYKVANYYSAAYFPDNNFTFRKVLAFEDATDSDIHAVLQEGLTGDRPMAELEHGCIRMAIEQCNRVKAAIDANAPPEETVRALSEIIQVDDPTSLERNLRDNPLSRVHVASIEEEEDAKEEQAETNGLNAVEIMTIVGAKGLSADHVIVIGADDVNMRHITPNAFFVALTRARKSLTLISAIGTGGSTGPHAFVTRLPAEHVEAFSYRKGGHTLTQLSGVAGAVRYLTGLVRRRRHR